MRIRHEQMRDASRQRAEGRLLVLGVFFFCAFAVVGARMGVLATTDPTEPRAGGRCRDLGHPRRYCGPQGRFWRPISRHMRFMRSRTT